MGGTGNVPTLGILSDFLQEQHHSCEVCWRSWGNDIPEEPHLGLHLLPSKRPEPPKPDLVSSPWVWSDRHRYIAMYTVVSLASMDPAFESSESPLAPGGLWVTQAPLWKNSPWGHCVVGFRAPLWGAHNNNLDFLEEISEAPFFHGHVHWFIF